MKSKAKRFRSDLDQKNNLIPLEAKKASQNYFLFLISKKLIIFPQEKLLQFVCVAAGGLVAELKKGGSDTRQLLARMIEEIVELDPEFILKVCI